MSKPKKKARRSRKATPKTEPGAGWTGSKAGGRQLPEGWTGRKTPAP